ncbi:SLBB domain-containing protein [Candidatus Latescibacterota bacterium]
MTVSQVDIVNTVRDAGIVGAGGAGFPTHVKLSNEVDTFIANGVECEPVLKADKYLMERSAPAIIRGMEAAIEQVSAGKGVISIKNKNSGAIAAVERAIRGKSGLEIGILGDYYPAGDEQVLIRQITGRIVPPGGLPFMAGVTVSNVATLKQIADALDGKNVTTRVVTIGGEVARPVTIEVPIGTSIRDLVAHAGGMTVDDYEVVVGGPVMGVISSIDDTITKTIGGVVVLPSDHDVIRLKRQPFRVTKYLAKMCCTCQECTILCPRNALGHPISPAKIMSYSWHIDEIIRQIEHRELDPFTEQMVFESLLCCQCGLCEQYACIFGLSPNKVYALVSDAIQRSGLKFDFLKLPQHEGNMFEFRKLPALTLSRKLGLAKYLVHTEFEDFGAYMPGTVKIPLLQHIGAPAVPVVKSNDMVKTGDLIGDIPEDKLGARVHASIDGVVTEVTGEFIVIRGSGG